MEAVRPVFSLLGSIRSVRRNGVWELPSLNGREIVLLLGLGNPHIVREIVKRLKPNQICIVCDAQEEMGTLLCRHFPGFLDFLERPGSHLFCGEAARDYLYTYVESIPGDRLSGLRVVVHSPSRQLNPDFYDEVGDRVNKTVQSKLSDLLTRFEFEKNWLRHILINSRHLPAAASNLGDNRSDNVAESVGGDVPDNVPELLRSWRGVLNGIPGLIVAAGPSLRHSFSLIKKLEKRCFILCCDTAFKALVQGGVLPHAVITLDAQKNTLFHFMGSKELEKTVLFADIVANPFVLRNIRPSGVIFSATAKYIHGADGNFRRETTIGTEYAEDIAGPIGDLQSGGSVATSAFELLRFLGADPILFVGQDLAYTGREIHSTGTHHNEKWLLQISRIKTLEQINEEIIRKRQTFFVPALSGGEVLTDYVLDLYRRWFEDSFSRTTERKINLTGDGSRIEGAERIADLDGFIDSLPERENLYDIFKDARTPALYEHKENLTLYQSLKDLCNDLKKSPQYSSDAAEILDAKEVSMERFLSSFPVIRLLCRRSETYVSRNSEKLGETRSRQLLLKNRESDLFELERGLRPYFVARASGTDS